MCNPRVLSRSASFLLLATAAAIPQTASVAADKATPEQKATPAAASSPKKPLMRDFMGLNTHTVQFKPDLYKPVTRLLRDYHNIDWDLGKDTSSSLKFPMAQNGVNWQELYGSWKSAGYRTDVCVQFGPIEPQTWKDIPRDAHAYGLAFAQYFGPSSHNIAESVEIGNEPGNYPDPVYRQVFENMAKGMREGDPKLKIVTCATFARESGSYHKSLSTVKGLESLYDVISLHSYAQAEPYPTWRRSYPEDPKLDFLKDIAAVISWRDTNAPGKEVWLTEFGWDSTTKPNATEGTFKDWVGVTDTQQAQYIVRAYLTFSAMAINRAYLYWFNDNDQPSVHASSGITRGYVPKPSFHAMADLYRTLGDYRFARVVTQKPGSLYVYEYQKGTNPNQHIWAVWSPTGSGRKTTATLTGLPGKIEKAERMPLTPETAAPLTYQSVGKAGVRLEITESPAYLWIRK
jgi:serine/threonine-protein kinase ATR